MKPKFLDDEIVELFESATNVEDFSKGVSKLLIARHPTNFTDTELRRTNSLVNLANDRIKKEHGAYVYKKDMFLTIIKDRG